VAAESVGWEQSWRQAAARRAAAQADPPRLCGPGSMQILRWHPQPAGLAAAGAAPAHRLASGFAGPPLALAEPEQLPGALDGGGRPCAQLVVDEALLEAVLGPPRFEGHSAAERVAAPGTAAGLVWTAVGGKVQYIECICVGAAPAGGAGGRVGGQLTLTGGGRRCLGELRLRLPACLPACLPAIVPVDPGGTPPAAMCCRPSPSADLFLVLLRRRPAGRGARGERAHRAVLGARSRAGAGPAWRRLLPLPQVGRAHPPARGCAAAASSLPGAQWAGVHAALWGPAASSSSSCAPSRSPRAQARCPRTGPRRASPWRSRSCRCSPSAACAPTWP
jgi:hypothetical protein